MINVYNAITNVVAVYIFGSRASEKTRGTSDYDVAIFFRWDYSLDELFDIALKLARALDVDLDSVDVIGLNHAPVEFAYDIIARGKLIYCADDELRTSFEASLMREYMDLKPYLDAYYSRLYDRLCRVSRLFPFP